MGVSVAWWTDIHFELLGREHREEVFRSWAELRADCALVTGDISHGRRTLDDLRRISAEFRAPVYFVLGNHDYYGTSIARRRAEAAALALEDPNLVYLPAAGVVELSPETALVGHDGWGDGREGDFQRTPVRPPDLEEIEELIQTQGDRELLRRTLERLGDEAAAHFERVLPKALARYKQVVVAIHVPPLREATWYEGHHSDDNWAPYFCCQAAGEVLRKMAERHADRRILVLCGHCHGSGEAAIAANLHVVTRGGEPCSPQVLQLFEFA